MDNPQTIGGVEKPIAWRVEHHVVGWEYFNSEIFARMKAEQWGGKTVQPLYAASTIEHQLSVMRAQHDALDELVCVLNAAGLINLMRGVQLGPTVWFVKASDALSAAEDVLAAHPIIGDKG